MDSSTMNNKQPKYHNNGSIYNKAFNNIPNNGRTNRINSLPNGNTNYDHNNRSYIGGAPFDRMVSTASSQFSNTDSLARLFIKEKEEEQQQPGKPEQTEQLEQPEILEIPEVQEKPTKTPRTYKLNYKCRPCLLWLLVLIFFCSTISLGTLYIFEWKYEKNAKTPPNSVPMVKVRNLNFVFKSFWISSIDFTSYVFFLQNKKLLEIIVGFLLELPSKVNKSQKQIQKGSKIVGGDH